MSLFMLSREKVLIIEKLLSYMLVRALADNALYFHFL